MKLVLYLAGPMDGCNLEQSRLWRDETTSRLSGLFEIRNPVVRDFFKPETYVREVHEPIIVQGDLGDVDASDIILANCWKPSFGTPMEIKHAHDRSKHIVVVLPEDMGNAHPFLSYHSHVIFPVLDLAWKYLEAYAKEQHKYAGNKV